MAKIRSFHFDVGNSDTGPIGLCARIQARTRSGAAAKLRRCLPREIAVRGASEEDADNEAVEYIRVYLNPDIIGKVRNIDDSELPDGEDPR